MPHRFAAPGKPGGFYCGSKRNMPLVTVDGKAVDTVTMADIPLASLPNSGAAGTPWWPFVAAVCGMALAARPGRKKKEGPGDGTGKE